MDSLKNHSVYFLSPRLRKTTLESQLNFTAKLQSFIAAKPIEQIKCTCTWSFVLKEFITSPQLTALTGIENHNANTQKKTYYF